MQKDDPIVDLHYLKKYTNGDKDLLQELIDAFKETAEEGLQDLKNSVDTDDPAMWKNAAHKLKGSAGYVGAEVLKALCSQAQNMEHITHAQRKEFFERIITSYEDVSRLLQEGEV